MVVASLTGVVLTARSGSAVSSMVLSILGAMFVM